MSYTIKIGHAGVIAEAGWLQLGVQKIAAPNAPSFPGDFPPDAGTNQRSPSYGGWAKFTERVGLRQLFFGKRGLLKQHPGVAALTKEHLQVVRVALDRYLTKHPDAKPGWCMCPKCDTTRGIPPTPTPEHDARFDADLARLKWLEFWIDEALVSGPAPAMENY